MDWFRDSWELWRRKIDDRIDPEGTLPANRIIYDNSSSGASSDTIQGAVDEIFSDIVGIEEALSGKASVSELSEVAFTGDYDDLSGTPNLADVATTGDYDDLSGRPNLAAVATTGDYDDLSGKPSLATVATTGDYDDLTNKPTLGSASSKDYTTSITQNSQDLPVAGAVYTALGNKANTSDLATVATSGSYTDLSNKPTLGSASAKDFTTIVTEDGSDLITSGGVKTALDNLSALFTTKMTDGETIALNDFITISSQLTVSSSSIKKVGNHIKGYILFSGAATTDAGGNIVVGTIKTDYRPNYAIIPTICNGTDSGAIDVPYSLYVDTHGSVTLKTGEANKTMGNASYPWCSAHGLIFEYWL